MESKINTVSNLNWVSCYYLWKYGDKYSQISLNEWKVMNVTSKGRVDSGTKYYSTSKFLRSWLWSMVPFCNNHLQDSKRQRGQMLSSLDLSGSSGFKFRSNHLLDLSVLSHLILLRILFNGQWLAQFFLWLVLILCMSAPIWFIRPTQLNREGAVIHWHDNRTTRGVSTDVGLGKLGKSPSASIKDGAY